MNVHPASISAPGRPQGRGLDKSPHRLRALERQGTRLGTLIRGHGLPTEGSDHFSRRTGGMSLHLILGTRHDE